MKILHLLSQRPDSTGSGVYVQAVMGKAAEHGYTNGLVAGVPLEYSLPEHVRCMCAADVHSVRFEQDVAFPIVGMSDVMPYASTRFSDLHADQVQRYEQCFAHVLEQSVEKYAPDIIHSNHLWLLTALACRMFPDIPVVASCHGSDLRQFRQCTHLQERVRSGCSGLSGVMALSREQKTTIAELYGLPQEKITVTGAGFNEDLFAPLSERLDHSPIQIVYAGKLSRAKGVPWLLRACEQLTDNVVVHIVGSGCGDEEREIQTLAKALGGKVVMHGSLPQEKLADLLAHSHIFVLPSFFEGLPLVLFEALACGCSLVATSLPGVEEIFTNLPDDVIRLVELPPMRSVDCPDPDAEEGFVHALTRALTAQIDSVRTGADVCQSPAARHVLDQFTWSGVFERIDAVYRGLL